MDGLNDYYATLGVPRNASHRDIKSSYHRMAKLHHPDLRPGDAHSEALFKRIAEAYAGVTRLCAAANSLGSHWSIVQ